jgi:hypothetical protein
MNKEPDKAPFFKSWNAWYFLVLAFLVMLIFFFVFFTKKFQ